MLGTSKGNRKAFWGEEPSPFKPGRPHPLTSSVSAWKRYDAITKWYVAFLTEEMRIVAHAPSAGSADFPRFPIGHIRSIKLVPAIEKSRICFRIAEVSPKEWASSLFAYEARIPPENNPLLTPFQILTYLRTEMRCEIPSSTDTDPYTYLYVERDGTYVSLSQLYDQAQEDHLAVSASPCNSSCST